MTSVIFVLHLTLVFSLSVKGCTANGVWDDKGRPALQGFDVYIREDPGDLGGPHGTQDPRHGDRGFGGTNAIHDLASGIVRRFFTDAGSLRQTRDISLLSERLADILLLLASDLRLSRSKRHGQTKEDRGSSFEARNRSFSAQSVAEPRFAFFPSLDAWLDELQSTFKRDMIFNVAKVGGIAFLYYFAPGVLTWIESTFGF